MSAAHRVGGSDVRTRPQLDPDTRKAGFRDSFKSDKSGHSQRLPQLTEMPDLSVRIYPEQARSSNHATTWGYGQQVLATPPGYP